MPETREPEPPPAAAPGPLRPHPPLERYYADEAERRRRVGAWFDATAPSYDRITQLMSFGSGHWYRRRALRRAGLGPGARVLDVACGTGVLAAHARRLVGSSGRVVALDPSLGMLLRARARGAGRLTRGTAEALPFADASFELVTMGYALRHVADLRATFAEYRRVLEPGGRLLVLEITRPASRAVHRVLAFHLGRVVPALARIGRRGAEARELFEYYWETIEHCVAPERILAALEEAGFSTVEREVDLAVFSSYRGVA